MNRIALKAAARVVKETERGEMVRRLISAVSGGDQVSLLLPVADLGPHTALFPAHLASSFAFPHPIHCPFMNEFVPHVVLLAPR